MIGVVPAGAEAGLEIGFVLHNPPQALLRRVDSFRDFALLNPPEADIRFASTFGLFHLRRSLRRDRWVLLGKDGKEISGVFKLPVWQRLRRAVLPRPPMAMILPGDASQRRLAAPTTTTYFYDGDQVIAG